MRMWTLDLFHLNAPADVYTITPIWALSLGYQRYKVRVGFALANSVYSVFLDINMHVHVHRYMKISIQKKITSETSA